MRRSRAVTKLALLVVTLPLVAGCFGRFNVASCEPAELYENASNAAPVQVPDDLTPPDESRALKIPPVPSDTQQVAKRGDCLESPPEYFEGGLPN